MPRPDWMPNFVPDGATLVIDPTNGSVELQWAAEDGRWRYRPDGAVLEAILDKYPGVRETRDMLREKLRKKSA